MLTRALYLSAGWLAITFLTTMLRGTKVRDGSQIASLLWLIVVLLAGDLWALITFGVPQEIAALTVITFLFGWWWIRRLRNWNSLGQALWIMTLLASILYVAFGFAVAAFTPLNPLAFLVAFALTAVETIALALAVSYAYESLDVCCRIRWNRQFHAMLPIPGYMPKVSLQIPAYNEPPEVVEATLRSLAELDYDNYEVLVVDNNTPEAETWGALQQVCEDLGPRFRFLHLDKWPGYKSGALNFALTQTAPDAEIIGIIDADYRVKPDFLSAITPFFADPKIAFVQTPQDYRDYEGNAYLETCHLGYNYFFAVSMPSRNEQNAIIFAGTMGLIRRSVLQEIGGWDEWCITEDAEASLRVLKRGYQSVYVNHAYGTGLMPYTFDGLKKQRFRWCFGGIQIMKKHWESLMPWARWFDPENQLTMAQRYYYLLGGLQWFNEPLNLLFTAFLITGALLSFLPGGVTIRPLVGPLIVMPGFFLAIGMWRFLWVLRHTLHLSFKDAIRAMGNFFSLGWTVALACLQGLIQPAGVFMRTQKTKSASGVVRAFRAAQWETGIGVVCVTLAVLVNVVRPQPSTFLLGGLLLWQAALYLAAPYYSLMSIRGQHETAVVEMPGPSVRENRLGGWAVVAALGILVGVIVTQLLPAPVSSPGYSQFQPQVVPIGRLVGIPTEVFHDPTTVPPSPTLVPPPVIAITSTVLPGQTASTTPTPTGVTAVVVTATSQASSEPSPTVRTTATSRLTASPTRAASLTATILPSQTVQPATPTIRPTVQPTQTALSTFTSVPTTQVVPTLVPSPTLLPTTTATGIPSPTTVPSPTASATVIPSMTSTATP